MIRKVDPFEGIEKESNSKFFLSLFSLLIIPILIIFSNIFFKLSYLPVFIIAILSFFLISFLIKKFVDNSLVLKIYYWVISVPITLIWFKEIVSNNPNIIIIIGFLAFLVIFYMLIDDVITKYKTFLLYRYKEKEGIKLYIPEENYWLSANPLDTIYIEGNKEVRQGRNIFISIKRTRKYNKKRAFQPIYNIAICTKLLGSSTAIQIYFNVFYIGLVGLNFIYYFAILSLITILKNMGWEKQQILLSIILMIILSLWATIHYFVKYLRIKECKISTISQELNEIRTSSDLINIENIDEHYLTIRDNDRLNHKKEIKNLDKINNDLIAKLDSIYQVVTPILFLVQVSVAIVFVNWIYPTCTSIK